ncbi:MAG: peptidoglycan DD-metalloendopeptidase family protein [Nonomuraea sp.]|nr:peptidoglycan DD-metalloendopeptidase family protein [Nonomuraea sp.]
MRRLGTILSAMVIGGSLFATASPAQAAARDGVCDTGEFCYYFNSNFQGSLSDFNGSVDNYNTTQPTCYDFKGPGAGKAKCIKNSAASAWNRSGKTVRVYFNSGYTGKYQDFAPGARANLIPALKNQNASHQFLGSSTPPPSTGRRNLSFALYAGTATISCGFDGYVHTSGRHEGIDITKTLGAGVHNLVAGQVINVQRGAPGRAGLSTIAVYNASLGKTVIYLHTAPLKTLRVGQSVARGQLIATQSWNGITRKSATHTHVEMRPGRQTRAAKSVGDPRLSNPNPTAFWNSQGYNVR